MYPTGDVRVENVPDAAVEQPSDALVPSLAPASAAAICGLTEIYR